ncbi:MAG: 30S ribosomal protein S17 [Pyrobaculum arsenaticum]|uniref:Small ribosomal subunit protein uS17 n=1 Tax=Pyrobaculum arsenaticum TaxID=121277 RepID=A0A7L4P8B7_9CREN|nr:30S ribosomal protein S17 [Pyrobaculum arsenaticum]MCY0890345.1 30S ribosomal protein S17 [Pyrobaculum arsenaticum]NYR14697.1 30S ribosomal protein S17 [Pyrobaculum arsenaticum]
MTSIKLQSRPRPGDTFTLPSGKVVEVRDIGIPWILSPAAVCDDPLCPWHGHLKVRLKLLEVTVEKTRMRKAAVVVHEWLHYIRKYNRYERRRRKLHVRVPECIEVKPGDKVIIAETRPLSKTISWVVIGKKEDVTEWKAKHETLQV